MKKISFVFFFILLCFLYACQNDKKVKSEIAEMQVDVKFIRFDSIFAQAKPQDLDSLKSTFPFMFKTSLPDSLWQLKMIDTLQDEIQNEVLKAFPDFSSHEKDIVLFFKHLKFHFPEQTIPKVITLAEFVDYKTKVVLNDDLLYISLDNYLGKDHRFYEGFQGYISNLQAPHQILPDIAAQYAEQKVDYPKQRNFLSQMIFYGKKLYFKEELLPLVEDFHLIGYSKEQLQWAQNEEYMIWQFFIERNLLYSSASDLRRRFLEPAPFTKFYLEIDNETPPRLGQYIGWQILKAYAKKHPDKTLQQILNMDAQELFNESNYKP